MKPTLRDDSAPHQIRIHLHIGEARIVELAVTCNCLIREYKNPLLIRETIPAEEAIRVWWEHYAEAVGVDPAEGPLHLLDSCADPEAD